jgi:nitrogen regulatory protein PII
MCRKEYIVFIVIANFGMGSKVIREAKEHGISGGTIFLGKGTAKNHLLKILGLDEVRKELVIMIAEAGKEDEMHKSLTEKFHLDKPNHGIAFSAPVDNFLGGRDCEYYKKEGIDMGDTEYKAIFTIVDRGKAEEVVEASLSAGAEGGTVIDARGAGIHENNVLFSVPIEPEKEIVLTLVDKYREETIVAAIREAIDIDEPGKGIMFVININKTSGIYNSNQS